MADKVRFGVISTAKIGLRHVIPAMQQSQYCEIAAIASRDAQRAAAVARSLGIPRSFGSYDALLADAEIDAVYNPLPNHLHVPLSLRAMEAGKHVLCEKPVGLTAAEAEELLAGSNRHPALKVMEAFMYRHHPQWQKAAEYVVNGSLGDLRTIHTFFSYYNRDPEDIRNGAHWGGGGLMDIGCYPVSLSRFLFRDEPRRVVSWLEYDPDFGTDCLASAMLEFPHGVATFTCSTQLAPHQRVLIVGTQGRLEMEIPFNAPIDRPCRLWLQTTEELQEITLPVCNQYTIQGDLFAQAILSDSQVPTPLTDAVANMRVLDALHASHRQRGWMSL